MSDCPQSRPDKAPISVLSIPGGWTERSCHESSHAPRTSKQDRHRNYHGRRMYRRRIRCRRRPSSNRGAGSERFPRGRTCPRELHHQRRLTARTNYIRRGAEHVYVHQFSATFLARRWIFSGVGSVAHGPPTGCHSPEVGPTAAHRPTRCVRLTGATRPPPASVSSSPAATNTVHPYTGLDLVTHLKKSRQNLHLLLTESYREHAGIRYAGSGSRRG